MILALLLALALSRPYHVVAVKDFATSRHTHVETTGTVTIKRREADGDFHLRINDGPAFIVAETIPGLPIAAAAKVKAGQCVRVRGIRRFDNERNHHWWEIHPIEALEVIACP